MQIKEAQAGTITPEMQRVADEEKISAEVLRDEIAAGHSIICRNIICHSIIYYNIIHNYWNRNDVLSY